MDSGVLTGLRLENIALIERLELEFADGFTVFTGETGAGKSILLDALDAILGGAQGSAGARLLRHGVARARIEASFRSTPALLNWLHTHGLEPEDDEVLLSRDWRLQEERWSSRHRIDGVAVSRAQVLELRPLLLDLTVQGQTQQLARPGQQRRWLDQFAGKALLDSLENARDSFRAWSAASRALLTAHEKAVRADAERCQRQQLLEDLEAAQLDDPAEYQRLQVEQDRLAHGVRLQEGVKILLGRLLEGAEQAPSVLDHLAACVRELEVMESLDSSLRALHQVCTDELAALQDLVRDLDGYAGCLESDPARLDELQNRMAQLKRIERRHGKEVGELIEWRERLRDELAEGDALTSLTTLKAAEAVASAERDRINRVLTAERKKSALELETQLMRALRPMGLANVRFEVAIQPAEPGEEGADEVVFLFSANPGQPLAPLAEVASGGEMSRFLLALKTCLAVADPHVTLLFDEIDTGVSGRVSAAMAGLLSKLSAQRQVFCVTHQPLLAAAADHHFLVSKRVKGGVTHTVVSQLRDTGERQAELAELAGGDFGEARTYAASLLQANN